MSLLETIDKDLTSALKAGDRHKATVLRGLKSDLKYKKIDKGAELTHEDIIAVLSTAAKKRRESIEQFQRGNRMDLVEQEQRELDLITAYLPRQLSEDDLRTLIAEAIRETGAQSAADLGRVMKALMPKVRGQADGKLVNQLAAKMLAK
ncbi:MAG TPA: GatB/YqeY domain-containing protein [candidate division Zixibacteria bacterium]|nr:GatB/YqeY domain-containing protein [candidate division Zixibacteria bacterium]MDD4918954.1 GatB/YqeY domain-containing protein [candidate division Zixibacteria bacterium]MDM7973847.1 GatB/YqeY domain-containing protein [candidate division Zixibacteria bacterium]HOD66397.1 GatB/YqeY domain-containing protein [candidate division Zixibacteria bacterium]HPM36033.1 GatB/YqeY domain-containing protein [candidate division Zixibacteria bacterium]